MWGIKKIINRISKGNSATEGRSVESLKTLQDICLNEEIFHKLTVDGYAILPFLLEEELVPVKENLKKFIALKQNLQTPLFYTSGRDREDIRIIGKELSWPILKPYLNRIVNIENTHIEGCAWLLKPPGEEGALSPHQDSSLVDETRYASFYGWMPLQDVSKENGTISIIPKSHLWGINFRSLDVPWPLQSHNELLTKHSIPIEMKAGEILLFEGALIHGSYVNNSSEIRAALNFFFKPNAANYLHFMCDKDSPKNKVASYKIDMSFFYEHNFRQKPNTDLYPFHQYYEYNFSSWSANRLKRVIEFHSK